MAKRKDDGQKAANAKRAHLGLLIDASGSMNHLREAVVTGANEFLKTFRDGKAKTRVTIGAFDQHPGTDTVEYIALGEKIKNVDDLEYDNYKPRGMTPLRDALLDIIQKIEKDIKYPEDTVVFIATITDGYENASEASEKTVKATIKEYEDKGWTFVYVGADVDAEAIGGSIGLGDAGKSFNVTATRGGMRSGLAHVSALAANRISYGAGAQGAHSHSLDASAHYAATQGKLEDLEDDEDAKVELKIGS